MNEPQPIPLSYVTTEDTCSHCGVKLANAERARLEYQGEAYELSKRVDPLTTALHDIFELAANQKSNRKCATDEGLIATALAAVRVIRKVCDEGKERERVLREAVTRISELKDFISGGHARNIAKEALAATGKEGEK